MEHSHRRLRFAFWLVLIAVAYFGAAKLGMSLSVARGVITPVWAPSGIALAALLVLGVRCWPAVAVGAFAANATSEATLAIAAGISVGNTLAAVIGAVLVGAIGFTPALDRVRSVLALAVGGALLSTAVSATNGVTVLTLAGDLHGSYGSAWLLWWFGDAMGILVVAPILLVLYDASVHGGLPRARLLEGAALLASIAAASAIVFLAGAWRYPYLIFPLLLWAALRFKQIGAATSAFLVGAIGTWGAVADSVPLGGETATERVQLAQASFAVVVVSLLVLGATLAEREAASSALARTASRLAEAQALAHIGSWEWDIGGDLVTWSDELYLVFGLERGRVEPLTYATYLELVHPDDRELADRAVKAALEDGQPYALEHRIVRPDGHERIVASRGRVVFHGQEPAKMVGTGQDVTEQRQVEKLREDILSAVSHELRTPLTSVLGFALTLEKHGRDLTPETVHETAAALAQAARRLDRLLADLLDVERLRRGVLVLRRERVDVAELTRRVVADCELDGRELRLDCEPVVADVDPAKLERIVENLVVNADKHTPRGSSIDVRLTARGRDVLLVVEDDGPGIADEFKEDIFETFNRGPNMLAMTPGAGIGLSLVARFAAVHGGRSWVEDNAAGGASFHVFLPGCVCDVTRPAGVS
ncbi:MAG TPA: MASE1 domain-containing protein [Gaiellaceae bacterium]|nr:MASE1 domain-containing protein [Gaiellaceae bacterium]